MEVVIDILFYFYCCDIFVYFCLWFDGIWMVDRLVIECCRNRGMIFKGLL